MLKAHWAALVLLLSVLTYWDASPSEPVHGIQNDQPETQAPTSSQTAPAGDEQPTKDAVALFKSLMAIAKQEAAREAAQEAAQKQNQSGLARVGKFIVTWFRRFVRDPNSVFAFGVMLFTAVLAGVSIRQGNQQQQALKLAQQEFISTHRPRLRVRLLVSDPLRHGEPIEMQYQIANVGDTRARIQRNEVTLIVNRGNQDQSVWSGQVGQDSRELSAGQSALIPVTTGIVYDDAWKLDLPGAIRMRVTGEIAYVDDRETPRVTAFFRVYESGRFRRLDPPNQDREYED